MSVGGLVKLGHRDVVSAFSRGFIAPYFSGVADGFLGSLDKNRVINKESEISVEREVSVVVRGINLRVFIVTTIF